MSDYDFLHRVRLGLPVTWWCAIAAYVLALAFALWISGCAFGSVKPNEVEGFAYGGAGLHSRPCSCALPTATPVLGRPAFAETPGPTPEPTEIAELSIEAGGGSAGWWTALQTALSAVAGYFALHGGL